MNRIILALIGSFLLIGSVRATLPGCVFERYTSFDGLPQNAISDIHQDKHGFIWLCTWHGLSRFDGYNFRNYLTLPGDHSPLSHNRFVRISEDSQGFLWLTTYDNKLYRFDRTREEFTGIPHSLPEFVSRDLQVDSYVNTEAGDTWIALSGAGLVRARQKDPSMPVEATDYFDCPEIGKKINLLWTDSGGRLWVASEAGVAVLEPKGDDFVPRSVYPKGDVGLITELNTVYCMIREGELVTIDKRTQRMDTLRIPGGEKAQTAARSLNGNMLYIGTLRSGIVSYDPITDVFSGGGRRDIGRIRSIVPDSHGVLWITTDRPGITRYRVSDDSYKSFSHKMNVVSYFTDTTSKVVERNDRVWIKMNRVGFGYYDRRQDDVVPFYNDPGQPGWRFQNGVVCFMVDTNDVLWMSTQARGLEKVTLIKERAEVFGPGRNSPDVAEREIRALMTDREGNIWAGNKNGKLFCYDSSHRLIRQYPDSRGPSSLGRIYALFQDSRGDIWVGTKGDGLLRMQRRGNEYEFTRFRHSEQDPYSLSHDDIYSVAEDGRGRIWVATFGGGINRMDWDNGRARFINPQNGFTNYPFETGNRVRYLILRNDTTMLAATIRGLVAFNPEKPAGEMEFTHIRKIPGDRHSLGSNDVIHMFNGFHGNIWFSTFGGGINVMRKSEDVSHPRFDIYASDEGLSSNIVFAAVQDRKGNVWLSTENGISCFSPSTGTFSNYSLYDGIPVASFSEATATADASGKIYFGGTEGIFCIRPDSIENVRVNYKLAFTGLQMRNKEVKPGQNSPLETAISECAGITLPHNYSIFRIDYSSLNYRMQPQTSYMYILDDYERDWNMAGKVRSASYSNVPPGDYTLRVRCYADDNPTQSELISMQITILPPPWKSTWAYMGYLLLGILLFWIIFRTLTTMFALRQKVQMEKQMTELKLGFFTNVSHELRSPLTLILGGIDEVYKREKLSPKGETNIRLARKNAQRMLTMINQLLDFRKIVRDKMELRISQVDIVQLARTAAEDYMELAAENNINFRLEVQKTPLMAWVDPERIDSLIDNLLSNAFKFTPRDGTVTLSVAGIADSRFVIRVKDTGVGISKENLVRIFEYFGQSSPAVWGNMKGSGIGLSLCKEIVSLHNGRIEVASTQGEGATFVVTLPVGDASLSKEAGSASAPAGGTDGAPVNEAHKPAPGSAPVSIRREVCKMGTDALTIMVVEDNGDVREFLHNLLIETYNIIEAEDGRAALDMLRAGAAPDVVITDLMMPRMDGIELTGAIRDDFNLSHIPIIILTARSAVESRISATRYGADDYVTKPFDAEYLMASIENLLSRRRSMAEKYSAAATSGKVIALSPGEIVVTDRDEEFIRTVMEWIDGNIENPELTIDQLASHLGLGRTTMYKKLKSLTGRSPVELIRGYRLEKAAMLLDTAQFTVSEVAYKVGFSDPSYFSKCFKDLFGVAPVDYIKKGEAQ